LPFAAIGARKPSLTISPDLPANIEELLTQTTAIPNATAAAPPDLLWYRNAIIYQMHVRSFSDSDADGIGDFTGLISKLDYLQELGVTALWLLPFYPSPLKDDGYDIADYTGVNPAYGTIGDVRRFIAQAHRRKIRVIGELVINHTSDQHPWFQRARRAAKDSPERAFYVWSDTPEKYSGARIIFKDFEPSNWSFDHVAGQYYWHRFFNHQPDLNFDNPAVHDAVLAVCDFWMSAGVDGVRLDAVPYLYEREGTSCENLPETHAFLRKLRKHVDVHWPGRVLLAEANQWPDEASAYFGAGDGDECQMNFHFPLMPRLFMALRMEDRYPIIDILEQTPPIPKTAQWAMFLRNHDELTLEMVTDEERDYMWRVYASDPAARINLGIRRRLAPLLENDRRKIELMNALLFSMPGTPVIYYGDEIGMGDNIFLGDRNGVRTPMQWSADRNAGFSRANPQRVFLPIIIDPEYHYETINVEAQSANSSSLLWWMKRLIALRKNHPVFGAGEIKQLNPSNSKVLAFIRRDQREHILVIANLSRFSQPVELDLSEYPGVSPVEMFGRVRFPAVAGNGSYPFSVGPHGFYWFILQRTEATASDTSAIPCVNVGGTGEAALVSGELDREIESRLLAFLPQRRWFVSKSRSIRAARITGRLPIAPTQAIFLISVEFDEGEPEIYAFPLVVRNEATAEVAKTALLRLHDSEQKEHLVIDGLRDPEFARLLLKIAMEGREIGQDGIRLTGRPVAQASGPLPDLSNLQEKMPEVEQSNSSVFFGDQLIFKLYRRLGEGINPELEVGEHLTQAHFAHTAPLVAALELHGVRGGSASRTLAVVLTYVPNQGDAWHTFLDYAQRYFEALGALTTEQYAELCMPDDKLCAGDSKEPPQAIQSLIGAPLGLARLLGQRTAEMHAAMADDRGDPSFAQEPYSAGYQRSLLQSMRNTCRSAMHTLSSALDSLKGDTAEMAQWVLHNEASVIALFRKLSTLPVRIPRIRIHGDYHLGQVLWTGKDFVIIDFEGEPMRSIGQRRLKRSPMRDVAGMIRSFDYAASTALRHHRAMLVPDTTRDVRDRQGALMWAGWLRKEFLSDYMAHLRLLRPDLGWPNTADTELVLRCWVLEKALYEVVYELNSRPDWVDIPLRAIIAILKEGQS
jgi:maltose alpha-D-glucosyltransferase/alpha-amylase